MNALQTTPDRQDFAFTLAGSGRSSPQQQLPATMLLDRVDWERRSTGTSLEWTGTTRVGRMEVSVQRCHARPQR